MAKIDMKSAHIRITLTAEESLHAETKQWYTTYRVDICFSVEPGDSELRWSVQFPPQEEFEKMVLHFRARTEGFTNAGSDYGQALFGVFYICFLEGWQHPEPLLDSAAVERARKEFILPDEPESEFGQTDRLLIQKSGFTVENLIQLMQELYKVGQDCRVAHPDMILSNLRPHRVIVNGIRPLAPKAAT